MTFDILKIFISAALTFFIGIGISSIFTNLAYKYKWWKKTGSKGGALGGGETPVFDQLKGEKDTEVKTPRMGGLIIWVSAVITLLLFWILSYIIPGDIMDKMNFLSRSQTWLLLATFVAGGVFGLINDALDIISSAYGRSKGLSRYQIISVVLFIGIVGGSWFYFKLGVSEITLPLIGIVAIGWFIIPLFVIFMIGLYSGGVIDGIDGLSGGVFASIFGAYSAIAYFQGQIDIAAFCAAVLGGILAYLWFNIPPARFWMTETGTMALTLTITVIAFLTDTIVPLLIIAFPLIATSASVVLQVLSKKLRGGKKIFKITPVHHHFEAIGWPPYKVAMRYWIISVVCAIIGTVVALI
ncbi:MAG TPA: hypothetical protein VJJ24_03645 [Candidatus Paceibacterota bacterium]